MVALLLWLLVGPLTRPTPALTPGAIRDLSLQTICTTKWGHDARKVTTAMKRHVAAAYGVAWARHGRYEFDHLVPRDLGGADVEANLWPQPWTGPENAHMKDRLEVKLHRLVCDGSLPLADAQAAIRTDWIAAFRRYVR